MAALPQPAEPRPLKPSYKAQPVDKRGMARPDPSKQSPREFEQSSQNSAEYEAMARYKAVLEGRVNSRIRAAIVARESSGIEEIWMDDEDQYEGVDEFSRNAGIVKVRDQAAKTRTSKATQRSKVFLNITKPKTDNSVARVQEMLVPNDDKPWDIEPTPVPDLNEAEKLPQSTTVQLADGSSVPAADVASLMKDRARLKATKMGEWIDDKFVEGNVYGHMRAVIRDAGRLGTGVLKGPFPVSRQKRTWRLPEVPKGQPQLAVLEVKSYVCPTSVRKRIQDCYPAPDCGDSIHDGSYFVEREFITAHALRELADLPEYDQGSIAVALEEGPRMRGRTRNDRRGDREGDTWQDAELFEVHNYWGWLTPDDMFLMGVDNGVGETGTSRLSAEDWLKPSLPCVAVILNGKCIKCSVNPNETGEFPFDFFPWEPVDGQPWGRGVPRKMGVAQRGLNAAVRSAMENGGLSAGPQIVYARGGVTPEDGNYTVQGRKLWGWDPKDSTIDDIRKAFAVFNITSITTEMLELVKFWLDMADIMANMPMLMQGIAQAGTSPDTLGGMKLLLNSATSPLRVIAKQFDDYVTVNHLRRYNDWGQQDPLCPAEARGGDNQIKAKGATVLVQRAESAEFLTMLYPVKDDPSLKINPAKLVAEMAKGHGFTIASIQYTEDEWKQIEAQRQQQPPPQDPAVQVATIRKETAQLTADAALQGKQAEIQHKAQQASEDRAMAERMKQVDMQIEEMQLAGKQDISLAQVKAMLAGKAMDLRSRSDEMALKQAPDNPTHEGI